MFEVATLVGKLDVKSETEKERKLIRVLTPLLKLFTAKEAVRVVSEGVECFGGLGYLEDSKIPIILRDTQVLPIWEGTTNILSLDFVKLLMKEEDNYAGAFVSYLKETINGLDYDKKKEHKNLIDEIQSIGVKYWIDLLNKTSEFDMERLGRVLAYTGSVIVIVYNMMKIYA